VAAAVKSSPLFSVPLPQQPALQLIYDTAPIGLAFLSPDCRHLQINQRLTEICGISVEDHLGRSVRDCVPALADAVEGIVRSIMSTGEPVIGIEWARQGAGVRFALIVHHTDAEREWAYDRKSSIGKLDKALDAAQAEGWTVVDMKNDWKRVFSCEGK
jgi:PAS domain-containing protein